MEVMANNTVHNLDIDSQFSGNSMSADRMRTHSVNSSYSPHVEDCLQRRLKFHFLDPIDKWHARRRCPWKLIVQLVKLIVVSIQLVQFVNSRNMHANFVAGNTISFEHLFLSKWDASRETASYPPSTGSYALYEIDEFYKHLDFAVNQYHDIKKIAIGSYTFGSPTGHMIPLNFCKTCYENGKLWEDNTSYVFNSKQVTDCIKIAPIEYINESFPFSSKQYFAKNNFTLNFDSLVSAELQLFIKAVHLKSQAPYATPDCYEFVVRISYDNTAHSGQLLVDLSMTPKRQDCINGKIEYKANERIKTTMVLVLNILAILLCIISAVLCMRSIIQTNKLKNEANEHFKKRFGKELSASDKYEFLNLWYVMILINDGLIITGTVIRVEIDYKRSDSYDGCSMMLATGNLLLWLGLLRYFKFFPKYNIIILTLKRAVPNVLRFLLCGLLMYCGFMACGWAVLGPYHKKFANLAVTSECLFSLINGDDMFATFSAMTSARSSIMLAIYTRIYLYVFISLFIYVVLSLVLAIILDSYETIKEYYEHGWPKSDLSDFISKCTDLPSSGVFRVHQNCWWERYCQCRRSEGAGERTPLMS